jgi:DNA mismatch endonuclease (patch repair protein)
MASIRKVDTRPELAVRKALHALGLRYRLHVPHLPGRPDIVFASAKLAVFVHGCFWHQHPGCRFARRPRRNLGYWEPKLARNIARDQTACASLEQAGWHVLTVWECEARDRERLGALVMAIAVAVRCATRR